MRNDQEQWQEVGFRPSSEGYDLLLRSTEEMEMQRKLGLIVLEESGVTEFVMDKDEAKVAFDHPAVTPEIVDLVRVTHPDPWDEALDALNSLDKSSKSNVLENFTRIINAGALSPAILKTEVRRVSEQQQKQLDRPA